MSRNIPLPTRSAIGVDFGLSHDVTAFALVECVTLDTLDNRLYRLRHVERVPLGTTYKQIAAALRRFRESIPHDPPGTLVAGITAVGSPVLELLQRSGIGATIVPAVVTSAHTPTISEGRRMVPRRDLATTLALMLEDYALQIPCQLPSASLLIQEFQQFRASVVPAASQDDLASWRERDHDDMVLAVALACWWLRPKAPCGESNAGRIV